MLTDEIREKYLSFFESKGHKRVSSDSLIPENDPTLLFTGAGMNQFKEYFLGIKKDFKRAVSSQKCLRTGDLDNVGKTPCHHSFFEMLGNFSFGDYFKEEAITWAWEFLTDVLQIPSEKLVVSIHTNDEDAYFIWKNKVGLSDNKIYKFGDKDNFWPSNAIKDGPNGPCGPCSEIFFDSGIGCGSENCSPACDCRRYSEIWNLVFTQYERKDGGELSSLPSKNIDTGMGLERIAAVMQGKRTNYEIDIFLPINEAVKKNVAVSDYRLSQIYAISDHIRAVVFAVADGAYPSNEGRGYVIRKLLRRALWHADTLGIDEPFLYKIVDVVVSIYAGSYPELSDEAEYVKNVVRSEEEKFLKTLRAGREILREIIDRAKAEGKAVISGEDIFMLYDTYGFPEELSRMEAEKSGLEIDAEEFEKLMSEQKERAKKATDISADIFAVDRLEEELAGLKDTEFLGYETDCCDGNVIFLYSDSALDKLSCGEEGIVVLDMTPFYAESGGQVGDTGVIDNEFVELRVFDTQKKGGVFYHRVKVIKGEVRVGDVVRACIDEKKRKKIAANHTATHLLQAALRSVVSRHIRQLGSMVNAEKLRFDFSFQRALTPDEKIKVENFVNEAIDKGYDVETSVTTIERAKDAGALAFFGERYGEKVRLVAVDGISKELCGGTHVKNVRDIGKFKIIGESSAASGIRRIEAVTGDDVDRIEDDIRRKKEEERRKAEEKKRAMEEKGKMLGRILSDEYIAKIAENVKDIDGIGYVIWKFDGLGQKELVAVYDKIKKKTERRVILLFSVDSDNDKVSFIVGLSSDLKDGGSLSAGEIVRYLNEKFGGRGGGKRMLAFSGFKGVVKLDEWLENL